MDQLVLILTGAFFMLALFSGYALSGRWRFLGVVFVIAFISCLVWGPSFLDRYPWYEVEENFTAVAIPGYPGIIFTQPVKIKKIIRKREKCYAEKWDYVVLIDDKNKGKENK